MSGISLAQLKLLSGLRFALLAKHGPLLSWRVLGAITPAWIVGQPEVILKVTN